MKGFLLALLFCLCSAGFAQDQPINSIIGDSSWQQTFGSFPSGTEHETASIQTHLRFVLKRLENHRPHLDPQQLATRKILLQHLEDYIHQAVFPSNFDYPDERKPCFIDATGRICAVGYLIEQTAGRAEAERINRQYQYARIKEMRDANLLAWQQASGFSMHELAMIQPEYWPAPEPAFGNVLYTNASKNKYGFKDKNTGAIRLKAKYDEVVLDLTDLHINKVRLGKKWGLVDRYGKLLTKVHYDEIRSAQDNSNLYQHFLGIRNQKITILSPDGQPITDSTFRAVHTDGNYFYVQKDQHWGMLFGTGQLGLPIAYHHLQYIRSSHLSYFLAKGDQGYGLLSYSGDTLISLHYDTLRLIKNTWVGQLDAQVRLFGINGKPSTLTDVDEVIFDTNQHFSYQSRRILARKRDYYGLIGTNQTWEIPPVYDSIYYKNRHYLAQKDGLYGYYNTDAQNVLPLHYTNITQTAYGYLIAEKDGKKGVFNQLGQLIIPHQYDRIFLLVESGYHHSFAVQKEGIWKLKTVLGKSDPSLAFEHIYSLNRYTFAVQKEGRTFFGYTKLDTLIIDTQTSFDSLAVLDKQYRQTITAYQQGGKWGLLSINVHINSKYTYLTKPIFDELFAVFNRQSYLFRKGKYYGIITDRGYDATYAQYTQYKQIHEGEKADHLYFKAAEGWYRVHHSGARTKLPTTHPVYQKTE
ncbi:MAG: WG repeat-containing protein [Flammeovirgaceae bacterium]